MKDKKKKNETKDTPVSNKDKNAKGVKDSNQVASKQPNGQDTVSKSNSEAGKGDKLRRGITQDEWGEKWEKIFGKKEKKK
tara:strand:+ start:1016 stop:1255 length:240 start_codon:yes stop_codon:yes gene_type:complete